MRPVAMTPMAVTKTPRPQAPCPEPAFLGPVPYNWLSPTGRLGHIFSAWRRGDLAEVPVGITFDVVRIPGALAANVLERLRLGWARPGPVVLAAAGAEFLISSGSARGWNVEDSCVLREGLALLPPPSVLVPDSVAGRGWLVPPVYRRAEASDRLGLGSGVVLADPVRQAVQDAAETSSPPATPAPCG